MILVKNYVMCICGVIVPFIVVWWF